jgi:hypothetical protein
VPNVLPIVLHANAQQAIDGTGPAVEITSIRKLVTLRIDVSDLSADSAPSLTLYIECSRDGNNWRALKTLAPITKVSMVETAVAGCDANVRVRWTVVGSATFEVSGEAHTIYAGPEDIVKYGIPAAAIAGVSEDEKALKLLAASSRADDDLAGAYTLPMTAWSESLRMYVAQMAGWLIVKSRGADPNGRDASLANANTEAERWLRSVGDGTRRPVGMLDASPTSVETSAYVQTRITRGWLS